MKRENLISHSPPKIFSLHIQRSETKQLLCEEFEFNSVVQVQRQSHFHTRIQVPY